MGVKPSICRGHIGVKQTVGASREAEPVADANGRSGRAGQAAEPGRALPECCWVPVSAQGPARRRLFESRPCSRTASPVPAGFDRWAVVRPACSDIARR
nr:hypothetical protein [Tanacetum cinerariifolium]